MVKPLQILAVFIILLFGFIFIHNYVSYSCSESPRTHSKGSDSTTSDSIKTTRKCLTRLNSGEKAASYMRSFVDCLESLPKFKLVESEQNRFYESKVFFPLKKNFNESHCTWITMGIGASTNIEVEFKKRYPQCKMYGIEASEDQFADFEDFGKVIPYGVGESCVHINILKKLYIFIYCV